MQKKMWLEFPCSINDIVERNKSFAACTLNVLYTGENRNRTSISKEAVEAAIPTMYNCPIVCNYDVESDTIGGHDVEIVKTKNGIKMVNLTDAVGIIPEGAQYRWETIEDNGVEHEYLVVDGILWKRSSVYDKLKRDGISGQSMEVTVNNGASKDGIFQIYDFDFTAFCILGEGVTPCFESANIETFSLDVYKTRFKHMMEDFRKEFSIAAKNSGEEFSLKGGDCRVKLTEMMTKYGLTEADVNFDTSGMSDEELEAKFAEIQKNKATFAEGEGQGDPTPGEGQQTVENGEQTGEQAGDQTGEQGQNGSNEQGSGEQGSGQSGSTGSESDAQSNPNSDEEDDASGDKKKQNNFALMSEQVACELRRALSTETFNDEFWGEMRRYFYIDYDPESLRVYAEDWKDGVICAFAYAMNGDSVAVDFASYKRQKVQFVDFDEGESTVALFGDTQEAVREIFSKKIGEMTTEVEELRKFHDETVAEQRKVQVDEVFAQFADLNGNDAFEALKANNDGISVEAIQEKCFAIRGRNMKVTFSAKPDTVKLPVERGASASDPSEPYNGIFARYGF